MTPQILCTLFYSENFFTSTCHHHNKSEEEDYFSCRRKSETVGDIDFILAPLCSPPLGIVQQHIEILSRCKIFAPARTKKVRKKALISVLSMNLSLKWLYISHMFLVSLCASPRAKNDHLARLWLRCEISTEYTAKFYFNTQANFWMKSSFSSHLKKECKQVLVKKFFE